MERLQKIIAAAGIASRRKAELMIAQGLVTVNGKIVTEPGTKADPAHDHIRVGSRLLQGAERKVYLVLNKPRGYVSTVDDPEGRATVLDLVRGPQLRGTRVFPVGRLDYNSEGLLLLTNDGELMQRLTHASSHVEKLYLVKVSGRPTEEAINRLRGGVTIREEQGGRVHHVKTAAAQIKLLKDAPNPWYEVTLTQGRNRQIHRMFEKIGHLVEKIRRVRYGPLELDVEPGEFRELSAREVAELKRAPGAAGAKRMAATDGVKAKTKPKQYAKAIHLQGQLGGKSERGRNGRSEHRSERRPEHRPAQRPELRSERRSERRPAQRPARLLENRPENRRQRRPKDGQHRQGRNAGRSRPL